MAGLKRQRSWHEDFSRNFLRLFSRSKSGEQDKTEAEYDNREELEDESTTSQCNEADFRPTPEHHLNMSTEAQALEHSKQDRSLEGDRACDHEGSVQGDAERDLSTITPPDSEPCSPLPPVDGFFRRLGSLFLFTRAQSGDEDTQHAVKKDAETSVEKKEHLQPVKLYEVSHCTAISEIEATFQTEQDVQDTQLQKAEEDGPKAIENLSATVEEENEETEEEQERCRALACPPVVTHVTYRGFRKIRKMKRNQEVRLHSPISEGEEGHCEVHMGLSASDEEQNETRADKPAVTFQSEIHSEQPKPFLSSNNISSGYQSYASVGFSTGNSKPCSKAETDEMHSALSSSALQTNAKSNFDPIITGKVLGADENSACRSNILGEVIDDEAHIYRVKPSASESVPLTMESDFETGLHSQSHYNDELMLHLLAETPQTQCSNTNTATSLNSCFAEMNTAPTLHTNLKIAPDGQQISGHAAQQAEFILKDEDPQQLASDRRTLQLESKKIVESILTNALAALKRIDIAERENEALRDDYMEGMEHLIFIDTKESIDGEASLGQALREQLAVRADGNPQATISDGTLGSRIQADGNRSTPSSGYESIAGSDTDIRTSGSISADITSAYGLFSTQELKEEAVNGCYPDELELCIERNSDSQNNRQDCLHHSTLLDVDPEEMGETDSTDPSQNNELLPKYALSNSNITSVQQGTFDNICKFNDGQAQSLVGEYVCFSKKINDTRPKYSAKDNPESNNRGHALHLNSGNVSKMINSLESSQLEETGKGLSQVEICNPDSEHLANNNVVLIQDKITETHSLWCEILNKPTSDSQDIQIKNTQPLSNSTGEPSLRPDIRSCLAKAFDLGPDSVINEDEKISADPQPIWLLNSDISSESSNDCEYFRAVKVTVNDDQSQEDNALKSDSPKGLSLDKAAGKLAAFPALARPHLDLPGTFAIISEEEEETDTVFVNDTGPLLSPSTRRVKIYPFSLSPIYEEDSGREDASRDDGMHVPPATEEEQRSEEQQASSILSLLQSVSERLQSSTFSSSETEQNIGDSITVPKYSQRFLRPLWDRYNNYYDDDVTDGGSGLLLHQQLTGTTSFSVETLKSEGCSPNLSPQQETSEAEDGHLRETYCESSLTSAVRTANTPFYEYLKSTVLPSLATETPENKCFPDGESLTASSVVEMVGFKEVSLRPTLLCAYENLAPYGKRIEISGDVEDVREIVFPQEAIIQAQRGCWLLYVEHKYQGSCILLEEGQTIQTGGETREKDKPPDPATFSVGSIRRAIKDDVVPEIHLHLAGIEKNEPVCLHSDTDDIDTHVPIHLSDLSVRSGSWVAYDTAGFTGSHTVLEAGGLTTPILQNAPISCVRSLRPLRMGGLRVQRHLDPKMVLYEKPLFQGPCKELLENTPSLQTTEGFIHVSSDFIEPAVSLNNDEEQIELVDQDVADLQQTGLVNEANTIHVQSGVIFVEKRIQNLWWLLYDESGFCGNQFVLEEGLYPDLISFGCVATAIKSFRPIEHSFSEPSISLFSLSSFEGLETKTDTPMETMNNFFTQSLRVISGLWVAYEFTQFKGRQMLLSAGEYPCWSDYSSWDTIGSLRPLRQPRAYVQVQNRALGMALTVERTGDQPCPARILLHPAKQSLETQHWVYTRCQLKSKACVGARVALWEEHGRLNQKWSFNENGTISSHLNHSLVLDQRGGSGLDKDHLILNEFCPDRATQFWDIKVL
ncbi:Very large A-kinase anchor protein [Bagarius yarrelli]|uniref:Very large A-kinase anchor protein n=1 Tax=Bagarius yarrelli TaxID=175774 RepID=A0A556TK02_BAGYA|nr:Very large A-kinase anchor protein [Bagarius yarrelli]